MTDITKDDFKEYFLDIDQWDPEAIASYRQVIEASLSEVHDRERQLLNRSGALLSMNGVILSLIARFGLDSGVPVDSLFLAQLSVIFIVISSCIVGWVIIPPYRGVINPLSGTDEYRTFRKDPHEFERAILLERIKIYRSTLTKNSTCSTILSFGLMSLTVGLVILGLSLVLAYSDIKANVYLYILFIGITSVTLVAMTCRVFRKE